MSKAKIPKHPIWIDFHTKLTEAWNNSLKKIPCPPKLLILSGWNLSADWEKELRWREMVEWAKEYGFSDLIPILQDENFE